MVQPRLNVLYFLDFDVYIGTVMTGTVLSGAVRVGDTIEIPSLQQEKKVKSMQMFKQPLEVARKGDRLGICVTQLDPKLLERGLVCTPGTVCLQLKIE